MPLGCVLVVVSTLFVVLKPFWPIPLQEISYTVQIIQFSVTDFISHPYPFIMRFVFRLSIVWWGGGPAHVQWGRKACREDGQRSWYPQVYWWVLTWGLNQSGWRLMSLRHLYGSSWLMHLWCVFNVLCLCVCVYYFLILISRSGRWGEWRRGGRGTHSRSKETQQHWWGNYCQSVLFIILLSVSLSIRIFDTSLCFRVLRTVKWTLQRRCLRWSTT